MFFSASIRSTLIAIVFVLCGLGTGLAGPVDDARLQYIAGNYAEALKVIEPAAKAGDANAQNILADAYDNAKGKPRDHKLALKWWRKSAEQGFGRAEYNLGALLARGADGVPADPKEAEVWLKKAMAKNNADAFNEMGAIFARGTDRAVDMKKAVEFYTKAQALGSISGASNLGAAYATGQGVEQDYAKAFEYSAIAAARNERQALHNIGVMYEDGLHVQQDRTAAFFYYTAAMKRGYARSGTHLARMMLQEGAFWSNPVNGLAHCYWSKEKAADAAEFQSFGFNCDEAASKLTSEQVEAAKAIAAKL